MKKKLHKKVPVVKKRKKVHASGSDHISLFVTRLCDINGGVSSSRELQYSVPEGTFLGPILCLLYASRFIWLQKISVVSVNAGRR